MDKNHFWERCFWSTRTFNQININKFAGRFMNPMFSNALIYKNLSRINATLCLILSPILPTPKISLKELVDNRSWYWFRTKWMLIHELISWATQNKHQNSNLDWRTKRALSIAAWTASIAKNAVVCMKFEYWDWFGPRELTNSVRLENHSRPLLIIGHFM